MINKNKFLVKTLSFMIFMMVAGFPQNHLIIGTYGVSDSSNLHDTTMALSFKINTKFHGVTRRQPDSWLIYTGSQNWGNNIPAFNKFKSSGAGTLTASWKADSMRMAGGRFKSTWLRNFDWVYYLSSAYHKTWQAYESQLLQYKMQLRHDGGEYMFLDGVDYWTNRNTPINKEIIYGPSTWYNYPTGESRGYGQDVRYRGSGDFWSHDTIRYVVKFYIRKIPPHDPGIPGSDTVCLLKVKVHYSYFGTPKDSIFHYYVKVDEISSDSSTAIYLKYDLAFIHDNSALKGDREIRSDKIEHLGTEFIVENRTSRLFFGVEKIELYDHWIWENYFLENKVSQRLLTLTEYLTSLRSDFPESPAFYDTKLDYVFSIDEPHSIDSHDPIRILRESLEQIASGGFGGLTKTPKLFVHFYPEWDGYRNYEFIPNRYAGEVNPDPFVYYYHYDNRDPFNKTNRNLHYLLEGFDTLITRNGFLFTIDVWDQDSINWCHPSKEALSAAIMMNLAYGSKGIIYEPFYSYGGVRGLLEKIGGLYQPTELGYFVRDSINPRLAGKLGTTLAGLKFTGDRVYLRNLYDTLGTVTNKNIGTDVSIPNISQTGYFLATVLGSNTDSAKNYIMICNLESEGTSTRPFEFVISGTSFPKVANLSVADIEGRGMEKTVNNLDFTPDTITVSLKSGDAVLLNPEPVYKVGGRIEYNGDVVEGVMTLDGKTLTIAGGRSLEVNGDYILKNDLILETGSSITGVGYLIPDSGRVISSGGWKQSLFRGKENGKVKLLWSEYPGTGTVSRYKIYRSKYSAPYELIGTVGADTLFYRDTATYAREYSPALVAAVDYFVVAEVIRNSRLYKDSSNQVVYYNFPSTGGPGGLEKQGKKKDKVYSCKITQNYPNPFNPVTTIQYEVATESRIRLKLYDITGREITTLVDEVKPAGEYRVSFDASGLPSGVYIYRIEADKFNESKKLILLR